MPSPDADAPPRTLLVGLGLALLALVTFLPVLDFDFVNFDDPVYVTANPHVRAGLVPESVGWALTNYVSSNYHPVTVLSHMLDCQLYGLDPRGHHLTNLLLHLANTLLVFMVFLRLASTRSGNVGAGTALWLAAFAAALFAVHPLRAESVAWISDRKDLLSTFFLAIALIAYLGYVRRRSAARYLVVVLAAALAMFSKATAVTLPCLLLLLDVWPLGRVAVGSWREAARSLPRPVLEKLPLFGLSSVAGPLAVVAQSEAWMPVETLSFSHRLANAAVAYATYLGKTFVPRDMAIFYPHVEIAPGKAWAAAALLTVLTGLALVLLRRAGYLAVGWFWFLGALFPMIGIAQVGNQAMADRYTYVAGLGLLIAIGWGLVAWAGDSAARKRFLAVAGWAAIAVLAVATRLQLRHWESSVTLFSHALAVTPSNTLAHLNLAEGLREERRFHDAAEHYRAALELEPTRAEAHAGFGSMLLAMGRTSEAVQVLERAVELAPGNARMHHALAAALDTAGRIDEAIAHLRAAVELSPDLRSAHLGLADLLRKTGDHVGAQRHLEMAMALGS